MIWENGKMREQTPDELAQMEYQSKVAAAEAKTRPLTAEEVSAMVIAQQINTLAVDDNTAVRMMAFYPTWETGVAYPIGYKVQYDGRLWRVLQAHTSQPGWEPSNTAALWEQVNETHDGTMDDPIPYSGNLALENGKHYYQDSEIYRCIRDSVNPVYQPLSQLVGLYVETAY